MDEEPDWEGAGGFGEHRTVGLRAWCHQDSEWCAHGDLCPCCDQAAIPERWQGLNVGDVLAELRAEIEEMMWQGKGLGSHGANWALQRVLDSLNGVK